MFCKNCGQQIADGSAKCSYCGKVLVTISPTSVNQAPVNQTSVNTDPVIMNQNNSVNMAPVNNVAAAQEQSFSFTPANITEATQVNATAAPEAVQEQEPQKYDIDNSKNSDLINTLNNEIARLNSEIEDYKNKIDESKTEIETYREKIIACNDNISQYTVEIKGREEQISAVKNTISVLS